MVNVVTRRIIHPIVSPDTQNIRMDPLTNWDPSLSLGDVIKQILVAFNNPIPTYVPEAPRSVPVQSPPAVLQNSQYPHATGAGIPPAQRVPLPPPNSVPQDTNTQLARAMKTPEQVTHPDFFQNKLVAPEKATPPTLPTEFPELYTFPMATLTTLFDNVEAGEAFLLQSVPMLTKLREEVRATFAATQKKVESLKSDQTLLSHAKEELERQESETKAALEELLEVQRDCEELSEKFASKQFVKAYKQRANEEESDANSLREVCFRELIDTSTRTMSKEEKNNILDKNYMLLREMKDSMFEAYTKGHISRVKAEVLASKGFDS